ncbi:MAG: hypothetical protein ACLS48_07840 [[Eubacterium] siraeum]
MMLADKNNLDFDEEMGIPEKEVDERFVKAVEIAKEISRAKGKPTCEYDIEKKHHICCTRTDTENTT